MTTKDQVKLTYLVLVRTTPSSNGLKNMVCSRKLHKRFPSNLSHLQSHHIPTHTVMLRMKMERSSCKGASSRYYQASAMILPALVNMRPTSKRRGFRVRSLNIRPRTSYLIASN